MKAVSILWDLDGVILDNEIAHLEVEVRTLRAFGVPLTIEIAREYMGIRLDEYFKKIRERFRVSTPLDALVSRHMETLYRCYAETFPLTPHVREVLDLFHTRYTQSLATNRERVLARAALANHRVEHCFDAFVFGDDVLLGKPDPAVYLKAASLLEQDPGSCIVIEDSENGLAAAKQAGMKVVIRKGEHNEQTAFKEADAVIGDMRDLPRIVESLIP